MPSLVVAWAILANAGRTLAQEDVDNYHQECWESGSCTDDGASVCQWCGLHESRHMYCCRWEYSYQPGDHCYDADMGWPWSHRCAVLNTDKYHQECWYAGGCQDDGATACQWCGPHFGKDMHCCRSDWSYPPGHHCYGADLGPQGDHRCTAEDRCAVGYVVAVGDIPGYGEVNGKGAAQYVQSCEECGQMCDEEVACRSYECSPTYMRCNLNAEREPTAGSYLDYDFCQKVKAHHTPAKYSEGDDGSNACPAKDKTLTAEQCNQAAGDYNVSLERTKNHEVPFGCYFHRESSKMVFNAHAIGNGTTGCLPVCMRSSPRPRPPPASATKKLPWGAGTGRLPVRFLATVALLGLCFSCYLYQGRGSSGSGGRGALAESLSGEPSGLTPHVQMASCS